MSPCAIGDRDRASPSSAALQTGTAPAAIAASAVPVCRLRGRSIFKVFSLAGLSAEESVSSPLLSSREDDSDSDDDSSDDDVPLRTLIRSKPSLAGSMVSAVTSET